MTVFSEEKKKLKNKYHWTAIDVLFPSDLGKREFTYLFFLLYLIVLELYEEPNSCWQRDNV